MKADALEIRKSFTYLFDIEKMCTFPKSRMSILQKVLKSVFFF